jgi:hypothetical protein
MGERHTQMTLEEQTKHFSDELTRLTDRFANEYNLNYESMVGAMELHKQWLLHGLFTTWDEQQRRQRED